MPKLTINGREIEVPAGITVLQACEMLGIEIPRFCYHERLSIAGNCRMCLVEMEKSPKPIASCAMPAADGMVIHTHSPVARKARQGVMEFLLLNHPLDCPICDQGGECDLQDQAMAYGYDRSRYLEPKRAVREKDFGPLIKTFMTRCIQCTRCIRFATEVAGVEELGAFGRGEKMEVAAYLDQTVSSELSGNVIDLCPVGALTNKPYAFLARPWELGKTESIDVSDAMGSHIRVDSRDRSILRILPRLNEEINEEWISDKARFSNDGLMRQRLDTPYLRRDGRLHPVTWPEAFAAIAERVKSIDGSKIAAIAGDLADLEAMVALKDLMQKLGSPHLDCRQDGALLDPQDRAGYLFNSTIAGLEKADCLLLIGTNPRWEAAVLNARIRKRWLSGELTIGIVGPELKLTYPYTHLGDGPKALWELFDHKSAFGTTLKAAKRPMLIVGSGAVARQDSQAIQALAKTIAETYGMIKEGWNGYNFLPLTAAQTGGLEIGFVPGEGGHATHEILVGTQDSRIEVLYLLGADDIDMNRLGKAFVIYQGHHGDAGAHRADVILPGAAFTEKNALYINMEGRPQETRRSIFPPGEAREDWTILRALSEGLGHTLPYNSQAELRGRIFYQWPAMAEIGQIKSATWLQTSPPPRGAVEDKPFALPVKDFYMTNVICRASLTMAKCTAAFLSSATQGSKRTGTDG